jgi:hypothetical protein
MTQRARRASTPEQARAYRLEGHEDAILFALLLGLDRDYQNDKKAKKDVIDPSGDAHSVKSGKKRWQVFLYGRSRFETDDGFQALNGIGTLLIHCIDAFPPSFEEYKRNPIAAKERLRTPMRELKDRFQRKALLRAFLAKSFFNSGEVDYLTILHDSRFHVFYCQDVVATMGASFEVANSTAIKKSDVPEQKVLFRYTGINVGELEMRNDSATHYQEVRFNMHSPRAKQLLFEKIPKVTEYNDEVWVYGSASKRFGRWS